MSSGANLINKHWCTFVFLVQIRSLVSTLPVVKPIEFKDPRWSNQWSQLWLQLRITIVLKRITVSSKLNSDPKSTRSLLRPNIITWSCWQHYLLKVITWIVGEHDPKMSEMKILWARVSWSRLYRLYSSYTVLFALLFVIELHQVTQLNKDWHFHVTSSVNRVTCWAGA